MYAVLESGGKQYTVSKGDLLSLEKLDAEVGAKVELDKVLLVHAESQIEVGAPYLEGKKVIVEVVEQTRAKKVRILKFKRRKHHMKQAGHRQYVTVVRVLDIAA